MSRFTVCLALVLACVGCGGDAPENAAASGPASTTQAPASTRPAPPLARARLGGNVDGLDVAQGYTAAFYSGELDELFASFSDEMKEIMPRDQLEQNQLQFSEQFGRETEMVHEESKLEGDQRSFVRWARFEKHDGVIGVQWILHEDDSVAGFFIRPAEPTQ